MNMRPRRQEDPEINLTPLIDVVFLLLIFFMVSTTFDRQTQLKVDLPQAAAVAEEQKKARIIEVVVDRQGHFYLDNQELVSHDLETLKRALKKAAEGNVDIPIQVSSDRQAPFQAVIMVMDAAGQLGMSRLSFLTRATSAQN